MSDRCYVELICAPQHEKEFEEIGFHQEYTEECPKGALRMMDGEANGAAQKELENLAAQGLPFYGWHGPGCEYGAALFVSDGKKCVFQDSIYGEFPAVPVLSSGKLAPKDLRDAKRYWKLLPLAKKTVAKLAKIADTEKKA